MMDFQYQEVLTPLELIPKIPIHFSAFLAQLIERPSLERRISPEERISMTEAVKMYTNYSAYAGFEENEKGLFRGR